MRGARVSFLSLSLSPHLRQPGHLGRAKQVIARTRLRAGFRGGQGGEEGVLILADGVGHGARRPFFFLLAGRRRL